MTSRIASPDTDADIEVRTCLDATPPQSFVMLAGAGSGKTTSLVKALEHIVTARGPSMLQTGQRVACITYTEVAVDEISTDVANPTICHVSTIHSFLWTLIRPFVRDIKDWLATRISEKRAEEQTKLDNPRTRAATKVKAVSRIGRFTQQLHDISTIQRFTYTTGSDYSRGVLGHHDVVSCALTLLTTRPLLAELLAATYPIVFVDESQDTDPDFVSALKAVRATVKTPFCLGFFGDPMQKIYLAGVGKIDAEIGWRLIEKEENFRAPQAVLRLINRIRQDDDQLVQIRGRVGPAQEAIEGTARLFLLPADNNRTASLTSVREWIANQNGDQNWLPTAAINAVKVLVLVHRSAAARLGFEQLFAALNDHGEHGLKQGLRDGTAWVLRPFLNVLLPLADARQNAREREIVQILSAHSPALESAASSPATVATLLSNLDGAVGRIAAMLAGTNTGTVKDVLKIAFEQRLISQDERFSQHFQEGAPQSEDAAEAEADGELEDASVCAFLAARASELGALQRYILNQSPFDTHQGIKGAEFDRVLVVLDDEEAKYNLFSYSRYFKLEPPSKTDIENARAGKETTIDRTRRLFYVCCSRARLDLAVALFVENPEAAKAVILTSGLFQQGHILTLNMLKEGIDGAK